MSDLISASDEAEFRAAIGDVVDTFMQVPVTLFTVGASLDLYQEDNTERIHDTHDLVALVEYEEEGEDLEVKKFEGGKIDFGQADVTLGYDALVTLGLIDLDKQPIIRPEQDYMIIEGITFSIIGLRKEGQFKTLSSLVVLKVERKEMPANIATGGFDPITDIDVAIYYDPSLMVAGTSNIFGDVDAGGLIANAKNAGHDSSFDATQPIITQKPELIDGAIVCDSINDFLLTSSIPQFMIDNDDYTIIQVIEIDDENINQSDLRIVRSVSNVILLAITYDSASKKSIALSRNGGVPKVLFTSNTQITGDVVVSRLNWESAWNMDVNGTLTTAPDSTRVLPTLLDKLVIGANGAQTGFVATKLKGLLIFNKLITDTDKLVQIDAFITNRWL